MLQKTLGRHLVICCVAEALLEDATEKVEFRCPGLRLSLGTRLLFYPFPFFAQGRDRDSWPRSLEQSFVTTIMLPTQRCLVHLCFFFGVAR